MQTSLLLAGPLLAVTMFAQGVPELGTIRVDSGPTTFALQGMTYEYVAREVGGREVKNAPYSADAVTEITQTLSDGNRIRRTLTSRVARDSQGRTRREQSLEPLGNPAPGDPAPRIVTIYDPVAHVNYVLDSREHTARRLAMVHQTFGPMEVSGDGPAHAYAYTAAPFKFDAQPVQHTVPDNAKQESLGSRVFEGVNAAGTRTTVTIPAGQVGNERPIEIVDERWYSPDLQTVIMTRHSDPRSGEIVYKLTNIDRSEPDPALFQVPPDYRITNPK